MDIDKDRARHRDIMRGVSDLRRLVQAGIVARVEDIARLLAQTSAGIRAHLAAEDAVPYPALQRYADAGVVAMSRRYQDEMRGLAHACGEFARRWHTAPQIAKDPVHFRSDTNVVFKALHERIQRENREPYPTAAAL